MSKIMWRPIAICLIAVSSLWAASIKLYLNDGSYHTVREYEVKSGRVRFYSLERSQWEEMPLDLVDLIRTKGEHEEKTEFAKEEQEFWDEEEQVMRERRREIASIPADIGAYFIDAGEVRALPHADLEIKTNKKKQILATISPVPMIAGEQNVRVLGRHSGFVVTTATPEFYIRLIHEERFGLLKLKAGKEWRHVEKWDIAPVVNQVSESHEDINVFRWQAEDGLYKVWPKAPLEPGEYAVVEFSMGEANIQVWDFGYWPSGKPGDGGDAVK